MVIQYSIQNVGLRVSFCDFFHEAHEDGRDLCAGGGALRVQLAVRALKEPFGDCPLHGLCRVSADLVRIGETGQGGGFAHVVALLLRVAVQDRCQLLTGDDARHVGAVRNAVVHGPLLACRVPRRTIRVHALDTGEDRDDHAARRICVRGELVAARAVHETLVDHIVDGRCVPYVAGNVCKSGLTGVGVERILRGFARRNDRDRRVFAADRAGRTRGVRFATRSLADLADTEMVAAAFSCEKGEFMSREPFEAMPDVMDAKQLAEALQISKAGGI